MLSMCNYTKSFALLVWLLVPAISFAQNPQPKEDLINAFKKERELISGVKVMPEGFPTGTDMVKYAETITASDLEAHLNFIASDELEGRETAQRGQKLAMRYLVTQFQKMGLQPGNGDSWIQEYELTTTTVNKVEVSFDGKNREQFADGFIFFSKGDFTENQKSDLVFAGYGIEDASYNNLEGLDLKGKAVVVLGGQPEKDGKSVVSNPEDKDGYSLNDKEEFLRKAGAKAMVVVIKDEDFETYSKSKWLTHMMEGASLNLKYLEQKRIPVVFIPVKTFQQLGKKSKVNVAQLKEDLADSPKVQPVNFSKYGFDLYVDTNQEVVIAENVLGFLEGTDKKDEVIVLTAHYDHLGVRDGVVFNGADDDGTGTVAILEIAEAFVKATEDGYRPRRSILFMPVSGEEKGLLGSRYYSDHPVYDLENTVCNLNVDMIGRTDDLHELGNYIYVIGSDMLSTELHQANEIANNLLGSLELDYRYNTKEDPNRYYYRSDHYNFAKKDIPCIFYFSGVHEDYHKATDTIEKIDFNKSALVSKLIFGTAWEVANREKRLEVDKGGGQ